MYSMFSRTARGRQRFVRGRFLSRKQSAGLHGSCDSVAGAGLGGTTTDARGDRAPSGRGVIIRRWWADDTLRRPEHRSRGPLRASHRVAGRPLGEDDRTSKPMPDTGLTVASKTGAIWGFPPFCLREFLMAPGQCVRNSSFYLKRSPVLASERGACDNTLIVRAGIRTRTMRFSRKLHTGGEHGTCGTTNGGRRRRQCGRTS